MSAKLKQLVLFFVLVFIVVGCGQLPALDKDGQMIAPTIDPQSVIESAVATVEARESAKLDSLPTPTPESLSVSISQPALDLGIEQKLISLYEKVNPSVVYLEVRSQTSAGSGSGFVFDEFGHIVTNNHVVDAATDILVNYADGQQRTARVVGIDIDSDLAVIQVNDPPSDVKSLPLSNLDAVKVGQFVVAIGNPFGEQGSMSLGIVSGLGRSLDSQRQSEVGNFQLPQAIQTDTSINPGNSGGPLLNLDGEVVGINSQIRTTTGSNSGVGFAIPVNAVSLIIPSLIQKGSYDYPYIGIAASPLRLEMAQLLGLPQPTGVAVNVVTTGSPAEMAGIRSATGNSADVILKLDGREIKDFNDLNAYLVFHTTVGQTVNFTIWRNGAEMTIPVTLGKRP